ncbi:MAG: protein TolQ [Parasphingopyxis sp.]|uniref:protein TolQ n=1 Tax=Parasphingopyxis sp. TaxID=1920299 RepID=UPI002603369D|nr:protein TolQ [uncultured Parasphingopyxis sp.]
MTGFEIGGDESLMNPLTLFMQADIVVKVVMVGLLLASIWTWAIIISHTLKLGKLRRKSERFEKDFWRSEDIDRFHDTRGGEETPAARVFGAGLSEWRRSTKGGPIDRDGTRQRLSTAMGAAIAAEMDKLSDRLNVLATVGAVAPFVGLFGTVWGIMRAFTDIAGQSSTSLDVVAPGIAEALFATALGLFAAIPAVIFYNRLTHGLNRLEARLTRFADGFHATLSRELETDR